MAQYMDREVPGVRIPQRLIQRMEAAGDGAEEEGVRIALEIIEAIRGKQGVNGIHIMAVGWEEIVPRIVSEANLLPMPKAVPLSESAQDLDTVRKN